MNLTLKQHNQYICVTLFFVSLGLTPQLHRALCHRCCCCFSACFKQASSVSVNWPRSHGEPQLVFFTFFQNYRETALSEIQEKGYSFEMKIPIQFAFLLFFVYFVSLGKCHTCSYASLRQNIAAKSFPAFSDISPILETVELTKELYN